MINTLISIKKEDFDNSPLDEESKKWILNYLYKNNMNDFIFINKKDIVNLCNEIENFKANSLMTSVNLKEVKKNSTYIVELDDIFDPNVCKRFIEKLNKLTEGDNIKWILKIPTWTFTLKGCD